MFQGNTDDGFCVWIGDSVSMSAGEVSRVDDALVVDTSFSIAKPNKWWECVDPIQLSRPVRVLTAEDGAMQRIDSSNTSPPTGS